MSAENESDWLFDYMMETFQSPSWEVPVMTFIDENCLIFDNDDENKFAYTDKHKEFCHLTSIERIWKLWALLDT